MHLSSCCLVKRPSCDFSAWALFLDKLEEERKFLQVSIDKRYLNISDIKYQCFITFSRQSCNKASMRIIDRIVSYFYNLYTLTSNTIYFLVSVYCQQNMCASGLFEDLILFLMNKDSSVNLKRMSVYVVLVLVSNNSKCFFSFIHKNK